MLWFAQGSTSRMKHFRPPPSPWKSAAPTRASRRSKRWDRLRAGLDLILQQWGADMVAVPAGASGFPSKTSRARIVKLWVAERCPQGCPTAS
jgi:hypothetical protein